MRATRTVVWIEDVRDDDGDIGRETRTFKECTIFDEQNWECPPLFVEGQGIVDQAQMRDGKLTHRYWNENREYMARRRALGMRF